MYVKQRSYSAAKTQHESFTPGWSPAYLFAVVFVKCVCIWRTSVFFQFYGVLSGVIYNYSLFFLLFKVTLLQQRTVLLVT